MDISFNGMLSMEVTWVLCFFSFAYTNSKLYSCALIHWFDQLPDEPDELTGIWMALLSFLENGAKHLAIIPIESIVYNVYLLSIFGAKYVSDHVTHDNSLALYQRLYVNQFSDHHAFNLVS
jgi:hypothetical protein